MYINPESFREYDIRGKSGTDLSCDFAFLLGLALADEFKAAGETRVLLGYDARLTSCAYHQTLAAALCSQGLDVINLGLVPSPCLYFAVRYLDCKAGLMVTASHNGPEYNGFKIWLGEGTLHGKEIYSLYGKMADKAAAMGISIITEVPDSGFPEDGELSSDRQFFMKTAKQNTVANISQPAGSNISQQITQNPIQNDAVSSFFAGLYSSLDIRDAYTEALAERFHGGNLLAVVDGGNGAAGELACHVLSRIGARIIPLYCEPDGHFPHHHPDPIEEANCRDLREAVLAHGADLGIGLDGDGDRLAVIDRNGRQLASDELLSLFAHDLLFRHAQNGAGRKEPILADVKCSRRLLQEIESLGGCPILCPTGHSLMKEAMRRENALIGGELAGHYFHAENWFGFDDGIFSAAKVLHILSSQHFTLEEIPHWEPAYATPELKVPCSEAEKFHVVERAREYFSQLEDCTVCTVDGVRVEFEDSWFLVRASNTGPHICLRLEAPSAEKLDVMRRDLEKLVQGWVQ